MKPMVFILKKGQRLEEVLTQVTLPQGKKRLNAKKYVGILNLKEDPLEIQKRMRDEWE
ncbi:MAG: hypothetical protein ABIN24_06225 [Dyadobacter sp.]